MASDSADNEVKGVALRNLVAVADKVGGPGSAERLLATAQGPVVEALRRGAVVSGGWYPLGWYAELHRAAVSAGLSGSPSFAWGIGRESTRLDLSDGIYKFLMRVVSPAFMISKAPLVFGSYYRHGTMRMVDATAHRTVAEWSGCRGFTAHIWQDLVGGCEGALQAAGGRDVTLKLLSGGRDGDETAAAVATWA